MSQLKKMPPWLRKWVEKRIRAVPSIQKQIQRENELALAGLEAEMKPYREGYLSFQRIPDVGTGREAILEEMEKVRACEEERWKNGFASGAVYHGDADHINFMNRVYALHSQSNPLHADLWPGTVKYEAEIVAMVAEMLNGKPPGAASPEGEVGGTVTSGGTESILLAMKTYRDAARELRGITRAEIVAPVTAHAAFDKAAQYFNMRLVKIPVGGDCRADLRAARRAINRNTVVMVGSAVSFPHGAIDPIQELSELASEHGIGFHTDACLGGFILPWARELGYPVAEFDFRLPGVTSISVDTHKYGYAAKGTSVILYRRRELCRFQYYATGEWTGGLYATPTFAGSRPGALSAACWAGLVSLGRQGYLDATRAILETASWIKREIAGIPGLRILGNPLWVIAFTSDRVDIYRVLEEMTRRHWSLNGLFSPPAMHICITLRHTQPGVKERFIADLREAVTAVEQRPESEQGSAPLYGVAATIPLRGLVVDLLKRYIDMLYKP